MRKIWLILFALGACRESIQADKDPLDTDAVETDITEVDDDGDGFAVDTDCDDSNGDIFPGADELCDGIDNDCDGSIDEDVTTTFYRDDDGDGFGVPVIDQVEACEAPPGYVTEQTDCNDSDPTIYLGADETCNGIDDDCDTVIDNDPVDASSWYLDLDGDGFGDDLTLTTGCEVPTDAVAEGGDCDDADETAFPFAAESCDGDDDDCDGSIDEDAIDGLTWYADGDGDGYGDVDMTSVACTAPAGSVADATDCDDGNSDIRPSATEICNSLDDDCDGSIDEDADDDATWYRDADGDGFGVSDDTVQSCSAPIGYVSIATDCDDAEDDTFPGAPELCNGVDDDCDISIDEDATGAPTWYDDLDGDGYGDATMPSEACEAPVGTVADATDCNDAVSSIYPTAPELCDGLDNDCSGAADDDAGLDGTWYRDVDGDGFGDNADTQTACAAPTGYVASSDDCDDGDIDVFPGADELCDALDHDCDGDSTAGATDTTSYWLDADGDGVGGNVVSQDACSAPPGFEESSDDCDDLEELTFPGADELCDNEDNDCDCSVDEQAIDPTTWYADADNDGFGDAAMSQTACDRPTGYVGVARDCDDTSAAARPGAAEVCDGLDNDCDGSVDTDALDATRWYADADGDDYGDGDTSVRACDAPADHVANDDDCDDEDELVSPDGTELCNDIDDDCNRRVDDGPPSDAGTWYADGDGDGFGVAGSTILACEAPSGFTALSGDCNDGVASIHPEASEVCNGADDDCNGLVDDDATDLATWYADADGDGFGTMATTQESCAPPAGYVDNGDDCDDTSAAAHPGGTEICDGLDNDCLNGVDDDAAVDILTLYADADGDGFGDAADTATSCSVDPGYADRAGDCDDEDGAVNPGATETCNDRDDDCNGRVDDGPPSDASTWYADGDGDGFGSATVTQDACDEPAGFTDAAGDCDDGDSDINPDASESCNGEDDDCNGLVDDNPTELPTWYADTDGDGFGDSGSSQEACAMPSGFVSNADDCDDNSSAARPGGTEICDGIDNDCLNGIDDDAAVDMITVYADADGDGFGDDATEDESCILADGFADEGGDCDDHESAANPDADEVCDGLDNDCNGATDESTAIDAPTWYLDEDGDDYGTVGTSVRACYQPDGYADNATDCNDDTVLANPAGTELCDGLDNDCNFIIDDVDPADATVWTLDLDGDGFGQDGTEVSSCTAPAGPYADADGDCDDDNDNFFPGATPVCDGLDHACDGHIDFDEDGDGWSDATCGGLDCDDTDPDISPEPGGLCASGSDCLTILNSGVGTTSGVYTIDPDGFGVGSDPFDAWCDMDSHGGGWTLVGSVANDGTRRWNSFDVFTDESTFGDVGSWEGVDYKSTGWATLEGFDLLVTTDEYQVGWTNLIPGVSFGSFIDGEYDPNVCSQDFIGGTPDLSSTNLSVAQVELFDLVIRAKDTNATCFPGSNENALVTFTLSDCCWTNGLGNAPNGQVTWSQYDLSMLRIANLQGTTCTAGVYPCNPAGRYHTYSFNAYDSANKSLWAGVFVR